jgi:hypothetical protein
VLLERGHDPAVLFNPAGDGLAAKETVQLAGGGRGQIALVLACDGAQLRANAGLEHAHARFAEDEGVEGFARGVEELRGHELRVHQADVAQVEAQAVKQLGQIDVGVAGVEAGAGRSQHALRLEPRGGGARLLVVLVALALAPQRLKVGKGVGTNRSSPALDQLGPGIVGCVNKTTYQTFCPCT